MITQVVEQIKNQMTYYEKCLQAMSQGNEESFIENLFNSWWTKNEMDKATINYNRSMPAAIVFNNYDDWKLANKDDYVSIKECKTHVSKDDFLDYVIENFDENLSDCCTFYISSLSPKIQKQVVDGIQRNANLVFDRLYELYTKKLVEHLEENYESEDRIFD